MKPKLSPAERRHWAVHFKELDLNRRLGSSFCQKTDLEALEAMQASRPSDPPGRAKKKPPTVSPEPAPPASTES